MAICGAEGALRANGAQERRETISQSLAPAEAHRRNGVRDCILCDGGDDLAVRKGLPYPALTVWNVAEEPSVTLETGVYEFETLLTSEKRKGATHFDPVERDPFAHILLQQPLEQLNDLRTFRAWLIIETVMVSAFCMNTVQAHARLYVPVLCANDTIQRKFMVAFYPKRGFAEQEAIQRHAQCPDVDRFRDWWTMRRRRLKCRRRIGVWPSEGARGGR